MAIAPQNEDAFFREVNDEVRRDQLTGAWRRYGGIIATVVAVALLALAAYLFWQHRREEAAGAQGEALSQALADASGTNPAGAAPKLAAIAGSGQPGYAAAARVAQAGLAAAKGDSKAAIAGFAGIAADGAVPRPFRDLAIVRQTTLEFDALPPGTIVARMQPFAVPGNPWFGSAAEMSAIAYLKQGKPADAGRLFGALAKDRTVPDTIRSRAVRMAGMLGVDVPAEREGATNQ